MSTVSFKRGANLSNLSIQDGQFIVNTAERSIYVDVGTERLRIGDFIRVATINDLPATACETALYLVEGINCLCYYNGTSWTQINRDTGMTSVEVVGDGNVITAVSYDPTTRKMTLTKGLTAATPADIVTAVGELGNDKDGNAYANVKAYVDAKTAGIATDAALGELTTRVATAEGDIDALQEQVGTGKVSEQIDAKIEALDLANTYEPKGAQEKAEATAAAALKEYKDANDVAVKAAADAAAAAQGAADKAQGEVDALEEVVAGKADKATTLAGYGITDAMTAEQIAAAIEAAQYNDTKVKEDIAANAQAIADEAAARVAADDALSERVGKFEAFMNAAELDTDDKKVVDTLKEIQDYIKSDETGAAEMLAAIEANEQAINGVAADVESLEGEVAKKAEQTALDAAVERIGKNEGDISDLKTAVAGKAASGDVEDLKTRMGAAEGKVATLEGEMDAVEAAVATKAEQETLNGAIDRIGAAEGKIGALEEASATHATKDEVEAVSAELAGYKTSNNSAVKANADAIAEIEKDYLTSADRTEIEASIDTKANAAEVYKKGEVFTQAETNTAISNAVTSALEWGSF